MHTLSRDNRDISDLIYNSQNHYSSLVNELQQENCQMTQELSLLRHELEDLNGLKKDLILKIEQQIGSPQRE